MPKVRNPYRISPWFRFVRRLVLVLVFVMVFLASLVTWPIIRARMQPLEQPTSAPPNIKTFSLSPTPSPTSSPQPSHTPAIKTATATNLPSLAVQTPLNEGLIILSMEENGHSHLFAYQPTSPSFIRLTDGEWDDITPAISPDGKMLAFSSNRDGQWDLYWMDIASGSIERLTNTPEYDAAPSFSPDGQLLAYESLSDQDGGGLEIFIGFPGQNKEPLRLTDNPAADYSPAWSPQGRQVAFVSDRSGEKEIWLADLDKIDDRFQNLSRDNLAAETHPAWSADGRLLAWASRSEGGIQSIRLWDGEKVRDVGSGSWPALSPKGEILITGLATPNQSYLTGYLSQQQGLVLPPIELSGALTGLTWGNAQLPDPLPADLQQAARITETPLWQPALTPAADVPNGRQRVVKLDGVDAPNPMLQDLVDESFQALRTRIANEAGWDFLSSLENAFVPLTGPLAPGMREDWLYTGRAFAFNTLPVNAGWVAVIREDFGSQTYWHIYLRTRFQDGTQGQPLHDLPWNFNARFEGNPQVYENGGELADTIPTGYWLDFTQLALAYDWQRLPALITWRSAYTTARFNEFVLTDQNDWRDAMLEIYPPAILVTPTQVIPTTMVPSSTPWPTRTPTLTRTPWPTRTPTPTRTPKVTASPVPSAAP